MRPISPVRCRVPAGARRGGVPPSRRQRVLQPLELARGLFGLKRRRRRPAARPVRPTRHATRHGRSGDGGRSRGASGCGASGSDGSGRGSGGVRRGGGAAGKDGGTGGDCLWQRRRCRRRRGGRERREAWRLFSPGWGGPGGEKRWRGRGRLAGGVGEWMGGRRREPGSGHHAEESEAGEPAGQGREA